MSDDHFILGHTNLICCFTSREASKSDSVGRPIFVNVRHSGS